VKPLVNTIHDTALIFEGGGMRASYTAATVKVLVENDVFFDWVGGISAGSSNTCNYVCRDPERARRTFVDLASDPKFGDLRTFVRGQGVFNAEYLYEQTGHPGQALPFDWDAWTANPARVRIGAFHCASGREVYWGKDDMPTLPDLMRRVRASSTMPGLMPTVSIDGEDYVDGALGPSGGIALDAARADGYERYFVVLTRPRGYRKRPPSRPGIYKALFRRYPLVAQAILDRHEGYNRTLDELEALEEQGRAQLFFPDRMPVTNQERRVPRLQASYDAGLDQAMAELPRWLEFLRG